MKLKIHHSPGSLGSAVAHFCLGRKPAVSTIEGFSRLSRNTVYGVFCHFAILLFIIGTFLLGSVKDVCSVLLCIRVSVCEGEDPPPV